MSTVNFHGSRETEQTRGARRVEKQQERPAATTQPVAPGNPSAPSTDAVQVSERAATVGKLVARAQGAPEVRHERVESLRAQFQTNSYKVSSDQLADAIVKDES